MTTEEDRLIQLIATRALNEKSIEESTDKLSLAMDITAVHCNGCKLDLEKLLTAKESDFFHDVIGIMAKVNRDTGGLKDHFLPHCTLKRGR